ncbi:hypothetical protein KZ770_16900 [Escherichia coli]|nr:hypothetical protein [Escherichia coli]
MVSRRQRCSTLTAEVTADSGEYQVLARWDTPKVVKGGELYASPDRGSG